MNSLRPHHTPEQGEGNWVAKFLFPPPPAKKKALERSGNNPFQCWVRRIKCWGKKIATCRVHKFAATYKTASQLHLDIYIYISFFTGTV
jgi:hypothetical protein